MAILRRRPDDVVPPAPREPKISVIIASYSPGDAVRRVIDSLDAQTMPADEFEVIFVDDGSPDDTVEVLKAFTATRPNMQVHRIENSGWPSRPRNVGIEHATGEYVLFMDHDDSLYPNGLARAYAYARETGADLLSPKESKTNDSWWGMSSLTAGNVPNALDEQRVRRIIPLVPHKLYRRSLIMEHGIRFPDGPRVLWEDWYINLDVYRQASTVAVLADEPVYLWHASDTNSSHTFDPARADFWDRLEQMLDFIVTTLDTVDYERDRDEMVAHNVRTRVIDRCVRFLAGGPSKDPRAKSRALSRSQELLERFLTPGVTAALPVKHRALAELLRRGDVDLVRSFHRADLAIAGQTVVDRIDWVGGVLRYEAHARWEPKDPAAPAFEVVDGRLRQMVEPAVRAALPPELLDHTDDLDSMTFDVLARDRFGHVSWALPLSVDSVTVERNLHGALAPTARAVGSIDLASAALDRPLPDAVWDVRARAEWFGIVRADGLGYDGPVRPALIDGRAAVVYPSAKHNLTLDTAQRLRTLAVDAKPAAGPAGRARDFAIGLTTVTVHGASDLAGDNLFLVPAGTPPSALAEVAVPLAARLVGDGSSARLVGSAELPAGRYTLVARRDGKLNRTGVTVVIDEAGTLSVA